MLQVHTGCSVSTWLKGCCDTIWIKTRQSGLMFIPTKVMYLPLMVKVLETNNVFSNLEGFLHGIFIKFAVNLLLRKSHVSMNRASSSALGKWGIIETKTRRTFYFEAGVNWFLSSYTILCDIYCAFHSFAQNNYLCFFAILQFQTLGANVAVSNNVSYNNFFVKRFIIFNCSSWSCSVVFRSSSQVFCSRTGNFC